MAALVGPGSGNHCRPKDRPATGSPESIRAASSWFSLSVHRPAVALASLSLASGLSWRRPRRRRRNDHGAEGPETAPRVGGRGAACHRIPHRESTGTTFRHMPEQSGRTDDKVGRSARYPLRECSRGQVAKGGGAHSNSNVRTSLCKYRMTTACRPFE